MTADDVFEALQRRHAAMNSGWVVLREAWAIDALAVSVSRGDKKPYYRWIAYEIKVSRSDFAAELRQWPGKAQRAVDFAHQYVFATPPGLLKSDEVKRRGPRANGKGLWVPQIAGLLEVDANGGGGRMRKMPQTRPSARNLTDYDIACLVRYAHRPYAEADAQRMRAEARGIAAKAEREKRAALEASARAREALARHVADRVTVGSEWMVPRFLAPYVPGQAASIHARVLCEVVKVERWMGEPWVWLRRAGMRNGTNGMPTCELGRFLLESEAVAEGAAA